MKVNSPLNSILDSRVKVECLRHLCQYPSELNGRQLSRFLNITPKSIHKAMSALVDEGIIHLKSHGNSFGYSINKENWVNQKLLLPLFQNEKIFLDTLIHATKKEIERSKYRKNILSVVLFGSVHQGKDNAQSDLDIFILVDGDNNVAPIELDIERIGTKLLKNYGVSLGPYVKSLSSFRKDKALNVIQSIISSNRLIFGHAITTYVR